MKKTVFTGLLLFYMLDVWSQDPQFSQFYSNNLYLAPSFAGLTEKNRIAFNGRIQWPEIAHGYQTYSVSFDKDFEKFNSGLGILAYQDVAGSGRLRSTSMGIQYSYNIQITDVWHIRPGMHFSYMERGIDFNRLLWNDQISATGNSSVSAEVAPMEKAGDIDFALSLLTYTDRFWVGSCVDHLLRPNQSLYYYEEEPGNQGKVPFKYSIFGGVKFARDEHLLRPIPTTIHLAFLYRQQEQFRQLDLGVYWYRDPLVLGFWYRGIPGYREVFNRDAFTALMGIRKDGLSIGYSYDFTISKMITRTGGAHEISLSYSFKTRPLKRRPRSVPCPDF